jgi:hypothetical protein
MPVLRPKLFAPMTRSRRQPWDLVEFTMLIAAGGARRKSPRHAVGNQKSIGSEKVPISADRARDGEFESTSLQHGVCCEPNFFVNIRRFGPVPIASADSWGSHPRIRDNVARSRLYYAERLR